MAGVNKIETDLFLVEDAYGLTPELAVKRVYAKSYLGSHVEIPKSMALAQGLKFEQIASEDEGDSDNAESPCLPQP